MLEKKKESMSVLRPSIAVSAIYICASQVGAEQTDVGPLPPHPPTDQDQPSQIYQIQTEATSDCKQEITFPHFQFTNINFYHCFRSHNDPQYGRA